MGTFKRPLRIPGIGRPTSPGLGDDGGYRGRLHRVATALLLTMFVLGTAQGCSASDFSQATRQVAVVAALDVLAADLLEDRPADAAAYTERLQAYLEAHPTFFGGAVAMLDQSGTVIGSPYIHRTADGYAVKDLAAPSYNIEAQDWFKVPLATNASVWTAPYFDAGGGEVWMITRSVPVRDAEGIFAIVTTDLVVDAPTQ